jgi:hypothetical protein
LLESCEVFCSCTGVGHSYANIVPLMRRRNLEISSAVSSDLMRGLASDSTLGLATNTGSLSIIFFGFHEGRSMKDKLLFSGGKFLARDDKEH